MEKINNLLINSLELPPEVLADMPMLTLRGRQSICVENFKELLLFSEEKIVLHTGQGNFIISGQSLQISYLHQGEIGLTGLLKEIMLEEGDARTNL